MSHLFNIKSVVLIALVILLFGLMVGQMIHLLFVATRKENRNPRGAVTYEALLLAHLLIACATVCSAYANHGALLFRMKMISFPIEPMMWVNAIALTLGLVLAFAHRRPIMTLELIALATCTPPFIEAVGINSWFIPILDASFFRRFVLPFPRVVCADHGYQAPQFRDYATLYRRGGKEASRGHSLH